MQVSSPVLHCLATRDAVECIHMSPSTVAQKAALYRLVRREPSAACTAGAIAAWQGATAAAEEKYCRGFAQRALARVELFVGTGGAALAAVPAAAIVASELFALFASPALFGAMHAEWVDVAAERDGGTALAEDDAADERAEWFWYTTTYSIAMGLLFIASGHRLWAPIAFHVRINIGDMFEDAAAFSALPPEYTSAARIATQATPHIG